jgi:hypothetical protein
MTNDNPNPAEGLHVIARHGLDIEALVLSRKADQSETLSDALREATESLGVEVLTDRHAYERDLGGVDIVISFCTPNGFGSR